VHTSMRYQRRDGVARQVHGSTRAHPRLAALRRSGSVLIAVGALLWMLAAMAGCRPSAPTDKASPSALPTVSSAQSPQSNPTGTPQELALAAYRGMWDAYVKAGQTANADEPDLARYTNAVALDRLTGALRAYRDKGQVIKGRIGSSPKVAAGSSADAATTVRVIDCVDTSDFLVYNASSGDLVNDVPGGRRSMLATVSNVAGAGWKVTSFGLQAVNTC